VFHVEFWVTRRGEVVIGEVHARPGGDWIHLLVQECYGIDVFDAAIADLIGDPVELRSSEHRGAAATAALVPSEFGRLERLEGVDAVRGDPRCIRLDVKIAPGAEVKPLESHYQRLALVVARGPDPATATEAAHTLAARLTAVVS
jgi:formate-dependent phosphoribosylglycinamide formyltransferase (GAR transformylase)